MQKVLDELKIVAKILSDNQNFYDDEEKKNNAKKNFNRI